MIALISAASDSQAGTVASLGGFAVLAIATVVLAIIAFILKLVGVNKASKDEHKKVLELPNWDNKIFKKISGIDAEAEIAKDNRME